MSREAVTFGTGEDRFEGVFLGLGWRGDGKLDVHQLGPRAVGVHAENLEKVDGGL